MPRNGSGTYVPPTNSWNPAVDGTPIQSTAWAAQLADISGGLSQSLSSDGQTTASAMIPFAQGVSVNSGTVSVPSLTFILDPDTGFYRVGANVIGLSAGGVLVLSAASTGVTMPLNLTVTGSLAVATNVTVTGNLTVVGTTTLALATNSVTNAKLAQVATATFKGRATASTGDVEDLTAAQAAALLPAVVGDSGSGGTKGLVPAPAATDAALGKVLGAGGTWVVAVPAGAICAFGMSTVPTGWLYCNGQTVSRTTYARLFAAISTTFGAGDGSTTFALPDLRGYFARGWDDGRGVDTARAFGSNQADELKAHTHTVPAQSNANSGTFVEDADGTGTPQAVNTGSTGGTETRPLNIALAYFIKD